MDSTARDERVSWMIATTIMVVAAIFTFVSWLLVNGPFTVTFDVLIVYLPTAVLVGGSIIQRVRSPRNDSTRAADSTLGNKAA